MSRNRNGNLQLGIRGLASRFLRFAAGTELFFGETFLLGTATGTTGGWWSSSSDEGSERFRTFRLFDVKVVEERPCRAGFASLSRLHWDEEF